eukprot:jgi/Mesvir1/2900/Mv25450-RA.1
MSWIDLQVDPCPHLVGECQMSFRSGRNTAVVAVFFVACRLRWRRCAAFALIVSRWSSLLDIDYMSRLLTRSSGRLDLWAHGHPASGSCRTACPTGIYCCPLPALEYEGSQVVVPGLQKAPPHRSPQFTMGGGKVLSC